MRVGELLGRQPPQTAMGPLFVIFTSPSFDSLAGVAPRDESMLVQASVPELAIEAFNY